MSIIKSCVLQFGSYGLSLRWREIYDINEGFLVWIIPLTYLSHEVVNWIRTTGVAVFAFIGFYFEFSVLWLLLYYSCLHPTLPPVNNFTNLPLLSYYTMRILCLISLASLYLLMYAYAYDMIFNACLWFKFIDTRVLFFHATWHSHHHSLGRSDSPGSSCSGLKAWSL